MTLNHVGIKAVHGLSVGHHDVVSDVYNVVDGAQADGKQLVLQPFGAFFHLAIGYRYASIAFAGIVILDGYIYGQVVIVYHEGIAAGAFQRCFITILHQPGVQVACHAIMTKCIGMVSCYVNLDKPVAFQLVIFGGRLANLSVGRQNDDAVVSRSHANFVFCTNHTKAFNAAQLRLLNNKLVVAIVKHGTHIGHYYLLSGGNIGCAAYYLRRFALAQVNGCDV